MISKIHFSNDSKTLFMKDEMINQYISNILIRDQLCPKKKQEKGCKIIYFFEEKQIQPPSYKVPIGAVVGRATLFKVEVIDTHVKSI